MWEKTWRSCSTKNMKKEESRVLLCGARLYLLLLLHNTCRLLLHERLLQHRLLSIGHHHRLLVLLVLLWLNHHWLRHYRLLLNWQHLRICTAVAAHRRGSVYYDLRVLRRLKLAAAARPRTVVRRRAVFLLAIRCFCAMTRGARPTRDHTATKYMSLS